jgi:hypothetical protein
MTFRNPAFKLTGGCLIAIGGITFLTNGHADSATGVASATVIAPASVDEALLGLTPPDIIDQASGSLGRLVGQAVGDLRIRVGGVDGLVYLQDSEGAAHHVLAGAEGGGVATKGADPSATLAGAVLGETTATAITVDAADTGDAANGFIRVTVAYN